MHPACKLTSIWAIDIHTLSVGVTGALVFGQPSISARLLLLCLPGWKVFWWVWQLSWDGMMEGSTGLFLFCSIKLHRCWVLVMLHKINQTQSTRQLISLTLRASPQQSCLLLLALFVPPNNLVSKNNPCGAALRKFQSSWVMTLLITSYRVRQKIGSSYTPGTRPRVGLCSSLKSENNWRPIYDKNSQTE